jgi:NAD(P)-dependent dehydrogenase (short-subunit alcohol dehydrogenase family)
VLAFDASDAGQARHGVDLAVRHFGRLDVLVDNAGSAGPKAPIEHLPLSREELEALRAAGSSDTETVADAAGNLLGLSWNMVRAAAPHLAAGASVINVSTISPARDILAVRPTSCPRLRSTPLAPARHAARPARYSRQYGLSGADREQPHPHRLQGDGPVAQGARGHDRR